MSKRPPAAVVNPGYTAQLRAKIEVSIFDFARLQRAGKQREPVAARALCNGRTDIWNIKHRRMDMGMCDERPCLAPALNQSGANQRCQSLADGGACAAILCDQFVLERDPESGSPFARCDTPFDVAANPRGDCHVAKILSSTRL